MALLYASLAISMVDSIIDSFFFLMDTMGHGKIDLVQ